MTTPFSELLQRARPGSGELEVDVPKDWLQGRSIFGGLQAALALAAIRSLVPERPLRSLQTNFIAPLAGQVRAQATVLRSGKNTTQVEAKLYDENALTTQVMAVFGATRASEIAVEMPPPEPGGSPPIVFPTVPGVTAAFAQHFGMRLTRGHLPFSGIETTEAVYQLDLHDQGPTTESHIVAFADVVPPLGMSSLRTPTFGSTLSWMLELLATPSPDLPLDNWTLESSLLSAEGGYSSQRNTLYSPHGEAMAIGHQCMLVFG
jgi:acyl-CoA thioesterase